MLKNVYPNIAVLIMVKNEENSIATTINSVHGIINEIVVLDTGSTDKTIEIIKETCNKNKQKLFIKETLFRTFPESRNDAIEFAESVVSKTYILLMDAGDELEIGFSKGEFIKYLNSIPNIYNYGLVKHKWIINNKIDEHYDVRFIRTTNKCRYDIRYPVHEQFKNVNIDFINISNAIVLTQNRDKYGMSTEKRYKKDIELLLNAVGTKRNYYYLAQTYMNIGDFENGYKYNLLAHETKEVSDEILSDNIKKAILVKLAVCSINSKKEESLIFKYFDEAINYDKDPPIDAFIFLYKFSIMKKNYEKAIFYVKDFFDMRKPKDEKNVGSVINHSFFDYERWNLISIICLLSNQYLDLGKKACINAIKNGNNEDDRQNLRVYEYLEKNK
jgi:glycosyltransferase involved in cell wall biosynthesis